MMLGTTNIKLIKNVLRPASLYFQLITFFFLWPFDTIPDHGLPLRGFVITLGHTALNRNPLG